MKILRHYLFIVNQSAKDSAMHGYIWGMLIGYIITIIRGMLKTQ